MLPFVEDSWQFETSTDDGHAHSAGVNAAHIQFGLHSSGQGGNNTGSDVTHRTQHMVLYKDGDELVAATRATLTDPSLLAKQRGKDTVWRPMEPGHRG